MMGGVDRRGAAPFIVTGDTVLRDRDLGPLWDVHGGVNVKGHGLCNRSSLLRGLCALYGGVRYAAGGI